MFSNGRRTIDINDILSSVTEFDIMSHYLNIDKLPALIKSPLREDKNPSLGIYTRNGINIYYIDFATGGKGNLINLLCGIYNLSYTDMLCKIYNDMNDIVCNNNKNTSIHIINNTHSISNGHNTVLNLSCKIREWRDYDIEYWNMYGITLKWVKYAGIYPISHTIIYKDGVQYAIPADKYAYVYTEFKDNNIYLKIYQPFNTNGYKWRSNIDKSVWGLWTKIPEKGDNLIISSSVKDCLNIMCNLHIPSICLQGEGYLPKPHIIDELKERFKKIIVFFDNDFKSDLNYGHIDALKICRMYNLDMVEIPSEYGVKDPSDLYKEYGKEKYLEIINSILTLKLWKDK